MEVYSVRPAKNIGYYFDSMDYRRYSTAAYAQHTDGKLRVLRVYRCAERLRRTRCGGTMEFLSQLAITFSPISTSKKIFERRAPHNSLCVCRNQVYVTGPFWWTPSGRSNLYFFAGRTEYQYNSIISTDFCGLWCLLGLPLGLFTVPAKSGVSG